MDIETIANKLKSAKLKNAKNGMLLLLARSKEFKEAFSQEGFTIVTLRMLLSHSNRPSLGAFNS